MPQKFSLSYHGSPFAEQIRQQGFRPGSKLSIAPGKVFSTPNVNFASGYGKPISMVTPRNAFSIPSMNLSTGNIGKEIIQNPGTATRQMGLASKLGTKYTGPTAQRLLAGEAVSGIGASQAGRNVLGRVLTAALGPAATYASALTAPNVIMASILDGPNVRSGAADEYVGMMGEAMPEEDYAGLADLLGIPEASQALDDEYYNFDQLPSTRQTSSPRAAGAEDIKEEGIFSLNDILADLGRKGVEGFKDVAGRGIASQALGGAGGVLLGPMGALAGGIAGLFGGGDLFNSNSLSQRNFDMRSPEAQTYASSLYGPGGLLEGYNQFSAFGKGAKGTIDKSIGRIMRTLQKKDSPFLQDRLGKLQKARDKITGTIRDSSGTITGGSGQGTIDSGNTGGYGGTGGEGPSAVSSSGMLGGGVQ